MKAYELHILSLFLKMQARFPPVYHKNILSQIYQVYGPLQWNLLSLEERMHFQGLEALTDDASSQGKLLMPVFIQDQLNFVEAEVDPAAVMNARQATYAAFNREQEDASIFDGIIPLSPKVRGEENDKDSRVDPEKKDDLNVTS